MAQTKAPTPDELAQDAETILSDGIEVTLAGRKCVMRRLDVRAVYRLARLLVRAILAMPDSMLNPREVLESKAGRLAALYAVLAATEELSLEYLAWLFNMKPEEFQALPGEALLDAIEALADQPDVVAFFKRAWSLAQTMLPKPKPRPNPSPSA